MAFKFAEDEFKDTFDLIPAGKILDVMITKAEEKDTKSGGTRLSLAVTVDGEEYTGRKLFNNFNLVCPTSEKAQEIGRHELASLCRSVGLPEGYETPEDLVGRSLTVKVTVTPANGAYEEKNSFRPVKTKEGNAKNAPDELKARASALVAESKARKPGPIVAVDEDDIPF